MAFLKPFALVTLILTLCSSLFALPRMAYVGASLALPGSGELLLGRETRGGTLLAMDVLSTYAFFATNREISSQEDKYRNYAFQFAGVPMDMPSRHYQAIQDYVSSDYYNDVITMMGRNYYLISNYDPEAYNQYLSANIYTGDDVWAWESDANWETYKAMRKRIQKTKMSHNLSLGIMMLNRVASAIDSAILSGRRHDNVIMFFSPSGNDGLMLNLSQKL